MTTLTASRTPHLGATRWERTLVAASQLLERAARNHLRRRAAGARHEQGLHSISEAQHNSQAAGALRMFGR
jgi:hypothetical protein